MSTHPFNIQPRDMAEWKVWQINSLRDHAEQMTKK